ncbi:glycosyltransferase family 87 protein [Streptomyces noursei]|uniref:glycosyltransferase family 87 protein n=1 Tax=Streptomyces noursei TaxID=1971 RepID=UPI00382C753B
MWSACAVVALGLGLLTSLPPHRTWGLIAAAGYGCAAVVTALRARRWGTPRAPTISTRLPLVLAVVGAVGLPLLLLVLAGSAQLEVAVVQRSGDLLLHSGSPYIPAPATVADHNPYLPGMAVFGLPHALFGDGPLTDARWWMAGTFFLSTAGAVATLVRSARTAPDRGTGPRGAFRRDGVSAALWLAACPLVALPLVVGGIDLPVIGLMCGGLATAGRGKPVRAGLLMGIAAALKWTAWPAAPVALALVAARHGRRQALACGATVMLAVATAVLPFLLIDPRGFAENVLAFPLGLGTTASPAESPLPGRLLAAHVPGGTLIAMVLLAVAALGIAASLLIRPPRTVPAAADRLAMGLTLAMALMPATRFGYLVYPLVLWAWPRLAHAAAGSRTSAGHCSPSWALVDSATRTAPPRHSRPGAVPRPHQRRTDDRERRCGERPLSGPTRAADGVGRKRADPEPGEETAP